MKVLLVNPPFNYPNKYLLIREPLSLAYIAAYIRKSKYNVKILDGVAGKMTKIKNGWRYGLSNREMQNYIKKFKPNVVGITCPFSLRIRDSLKIADIVKKINPKITTVIGGIHPTIFPEETVKHKNIDFVVIGEGEQTFKKLLDYLQSRKRIKQITIDGIAYKSLSKIKINPKTNFIEKLDSLPLPARDLLPMEFYLNKNTVLYGIGDRRAACLITSRSCPKRCTFCSMYLSHGNRWRYRSAANVIKEIKVLVEKYGVKDIFVMDDNLTLDKKRAAKICKMIIKEKLRIRWNTPNGVAANYLDKNLLKLMKKSGCVNICIGIESGNDYVRNIIIRKGLSRRTITRVLNYCHSLKLPIAGFFILGIPGDNETYFKDTLKMVKKLPFNMIATSFYTPFPGTELYNICVKNKYIQPDYWKKINSFHSPIVKTPDFDVKKLKKWEKQIYFEFFKGHWLGIILGILTFKNTYFKLSHVKRFLFQRFLILPTIKLRRLKLQFI